MLSPKSKDLLTRNNFRLTWLSLAALATILVVSSISHPFNTTNRAFADPALGQSTITVATIDYNTSNPIYGYYTVLTQNGAIIGSGFTTADFNLNNGENYVISVADYGDYVFDHWQDSSSSSRDRSISITSSTTISAVYRNVNVNTDVDPAPEPEPTGQSTVTVKTIDASNDNEIFGYYTILSQDGTVVNSGFSPAEFILNNGQIYQVSISDYGSFYFNYWSDNESTERDRTIIVSNSLTLTAVYSTDPSGLPPSEQDPNPAPEPEPEPEPTPVSGQSDLLIRTTSGTASNEISGYYVVLSQSGSVIGSGFSPTGFTVDNGASYVVSVSDYGDYAFDHWDDSGATERERTVSIVENTEITAIYRNINGEPAPEPEPEPEPEPTPEPSPSGQSTISIITTSSSGSAISGYYITLSQDGIELDSGFSPDEFTVDNGLTYEVAVNDYGNYAFDHWDDSGATDRVRNISVTEDSQLTAVYVNINGEEEEEEAPIPPPQENSGPGAITVYAYRIPSPHWGATFTSANANMFFGLYNSSGTLIQTAFVDENGFNFDELQGGATYYVYPADCGGCHNSNHDVMFRYWENGSTERPRAVIAGQGISVGAYFEYVPWE